MCCLTLLRRPRLPQLPRASKQVWKKLKMSTKSLHKLLSFGRKSNKFPATKNPKPTYAKVYHHHNNQRQKKKQLLSFLSPRQSHLKKRQKRQKYYLSTRQPPIFIDDLFHASVRPMAISTTFLAPSSSMLNMPIDKEGEDHEGVIVEGNGSIELTSPSMGIDERAEIFIASFRAELDRSFRKW